MKWIKRKEGLVFVEATIVMTISIIVVLILLNLGLIFYQKTLMRTVAYDTANQISHIVGTRHRDPFMAYMPIYGFYVTDLYRHVGGSGREIEQANLDKAFWYAHYRLKRWEILLYTDPRVHVEFVDNPAVLMPKQIKVTIEATFNIPFMTLLGTEYTMTYVAVGRASVMDIIDYMNTVDFAFELTESVVDRIELENIRRMMVLYYRFLAH